MCGHEIPHTRNIFYVGGSYISSPSGDHVLEGQMYVEHLKPTSAHARPNPLIFIHGMGQTGTNWGTKPDGSRGWTDFFLSHGYELYILDTPGRGRSSWTIPPNAESSSYFQMSAEQVQMMFTAPENYDKWPTAKAHTQWPSGYGKGVIGDAAFDAYFSSTVPSSKDAVAQQHAVQNAGAALLDKLGKPVILIGHSNGGVALWLVADKRPDAIKAIVALEPGGPAFQDSFIFGGKPARAWGLTDIPMTYEPAVTDPDNDLVKKKIAERYSNDTYYIQADEPPPRQLVNLRRTKVMVLTTEASYHSMYDDCTVAFLKQAGVDVEHIELKERGIRGNGHMMMIEKNSDEVAEVVHTWIENVVYT